MRIPTIHKQLFGNLESELNAMRRRMNGDIRQRMKGVPEKKRIIEPLF